MLQLHISKEYRSSSFYVNHFLRFWRTISEMDSFSILFCSPGLHGTWLYYEGSSGPLWRSSIFSLVRILLSSYWQLSFISIHLYFFLPWFRYKSQIWWTFPLKENSNWKVNISIKIYIRILIKFYHIIPYHYTLVIQLAYFYVSSGQEWGTCMDGAGPSPRTG